MLRIDQIPTHVYISIMTSLEMDACNAERDAASASIPSLAEQFSQRAAECREAKALMAEHRYPKYAELATVPA